MIKVDKNKGTACETLMLGKQHENLAVILRFDVSAWTDAITPGGVFGVNVRRHGEGASYPCPITVDGTVVSMQIRDIETEKDGSGFLELEYRVGDTVVRSATWKTYVQPSITDTTTPPPDAYETWVDTLVSLGDDTREYAVDALAAQIGAETAEEGAVSAKTAAEAAQLGAESAEADAESAKTAAEAAKADAESAATAAVSAKSAAEAAKTGAESAKTAAETAKADAESAATAAVSAKSAAEAAKTGAENAKSAAETEKNGAVNARTAAERARTGAEAARDGAETAESGALRARSLAETAQSRAETAKAGAESAKTAASNYAAHYPYIGTTNRHWYVWSENDGGFVDTGIVAEGQDGSDADVTAQNIAAALGYTPADETDVAAIAADYLKSDDLDGYVKNTDYASSSQAGVVKTNAAYGLAMASSGELYAATKTLSQYSSGSDSLIIGKGTLENVLDGKNLNGVLDETWTFTLDDDTTVTKTVKVGT